MDLGEGLGGPFLPPPPLFSVKKIKKTGKKSWLGKQNNPPPQPLSSRSGSQPVLCIIFLLDSFRKTKETFGQINIVCNNAGIHVENESDAWEKIVDVNLVGMK